MDIISLYYFKELAKELNMTKTAERVYISQQTLSNHVKRMEEELGVELFNRKPSLSLTLAGELMLDFAKSTLESYDHLHEAIPDIDAQRRGTLRFGGSAARLNACVPHILSAFNERYPNVEVRVTDAISANLEPMVKDGQLDLAIVLSDVEGAGLKSEALIQEQLYLCVPDELLMEYYSDEIDVIKEKAIHGVFARNLAYLPFCMLSNRMGNMLQACFDEEKLTPRVYTRSTYSRLGIALCEQGKAVCVISQMHLLGLHGKMSPNVNIFPLRAESGLLYQPLSLIWSSEAKTPPYMLYFKELLKEYFFSVEKRFMGRISSV